MITIREQIILQTLDRATAIRVSSPPIYSTDIGANVKRAQVSIASSDTPCLVVWPHPETARHIHGCAQVTMELQVEGFVSYGNSDASVIGEQILGDLIKCFASPEWDRSRRENGEAAPSYIDHIAYASGEVTPPREGDKIVGAVARFTISYTTAVGNPYSQ